MKKSLVLGIVLSAATLGSLPLLAQSDDNSSATPAPAAGASTENSGFHGPFGHMFKKLGLSDDQKAQIQTIRQKYQPQMKTLETQLSTERDALGQLMTAHASSDQALAEHKKVQGLVNQLDDQRFQMFYDIAGVLTADQRAQFHDMQAKMAEKWKHKGHHHHHDDGGEQD